jgi:hypothetical protein
MRARRGHGRYLYPFGFWRREIKIEETKGICQIIPIQYHLQGLRRASAPNWNLAKQKVSNLKKEIHHTLILKIKKNVENSLLSRLLHRVQ